MLTFLGDQADIFVTFGSSGNGESVGIRRLGDRWSLERSTMIMDVHAHYNLDESAFSEAARLQTIKALGKPISVVPDYNHYWANAPEGTRVTIFGGKARLSNVWRDDNKVAEMAASDPERAGATLRGGDRRVSPAEGGS